MTTEKYKCIVHPPNTHMCFNINSEYEFTFSALYCSTKDNDGFICSFNHSEFNQYFQRQEPTTTQPMKYKVTITSADHTGHEETIVHENVTNEGVVNYFNSSQSKQPHKTMLIEPMPEKKKVMVWFYVIQIGTSIYSSSNTSEDAIMLSYKNEERLNGRKVSEIQSMEVEI